MFKILLISLIFVLLPNFGYAGDSLKSKAMAAAVSKIHKMNINGKSGIYHFIGKKTGTLYTGKSINLAKRLKQHLRSGKLSPKDLGTLKVKVIPKKFLKGVEKILIKKSDKKFLGKIENKQHAPIARARGKIINNTKAHLKNLKGK